MLSLCCREKWENFGRLSYVFKLGLSSELLFTSCTVHMYCSQNTVHTPRVNN
ncbi:hypothetical protein SLEP1_g58128 [Rubroshorea leprosula]|uniref:Uncharacterized protein n=1 Tax=Rubroshorea leprosula TaxID=152421 RepID=A0AAV5MRW8_9ROSI|nr:hypothetical protein SLEP1_g58128 [Rubroshorea leprosula]